MSFIISAVLMGTILFSPPAGTTPEAHPFKDYEQVRANIGKKTYTLWVADDFRKTYRGLSSLDKMESDAGMLFILREEADHEFCMVDMNFPLDLVFLKGDTVVGLIENAPPTEKKRPDLGSEEVFSIGAPSDRVIELNAGEIRENKIKIGDNLIFH